MNNEDLQQLKAAALKATPGPWDFDTAETPVRIAGGEVVGGDALPYGDVYTTREYETPEGSECLIIASEIGVDNGRYLRAANPAAILALIAKVESLAADAERWQFRQKILKNNGCVAWALKTCLIYQHGQVIGRGSSEEEAIDAAMAKEKA